MISSSNRHHYIVYIYHHNKVTLTWRVTYTSSRWPRDACTTDNVCIVSWRVHASPGADFSAVLPFCTRLRVFARQFPMRRPLQHNTHRDTTLKYINTLFLNCFLLERKVNMKIQDYNTSNHYCILQGVGDVVFICKIVIIKLFTYATRYCQEFLLVFLKWLYVLTLNKTLKQRLSQHFVHVQVTRDQIHNYWHAIAEHDRVGRFLLQYFEFLDIHVDVCIAESRDSCQCENKISSY